VTPTQAANLKFKEFLKIRIIA